MQTVSHSNFTTVKTEGAILPADLLQRIADRRDLPGLEPTDYHLAPHERLNEAVNRAWNRCLGVWQSFDEQRRRLPTDDSGVSLTRERWLLILFQELGYGRLPFVGSLSAEHNGEETKFPISHAWGQTPIHLASFRQNLDKPDATTKRRPHSLLQEYLNRAEESMWGFVSNGLRLRVLRDNASLTRTAYLEFDLEAMMRGEQYADFALLWLVCHQSRVEGTPPSRCWLEQWSQAAAEQGTRVLDSLREGVQKAIAALGRGFLAHPANRTLKAQLKSGDLSTQDYYRQLLRLVYRFIFLFVAEDRNLLLLREAEETKTGEKEKSPLLSARQRYLEFYSVHRLRDMAAGRRSGPHPDLYRGLRVVFQLLREGYEPLALPGLGGFLFSERATPALDEADLTNRDMLNAIRALAFTIDNKVRRPVDYKNLGSEELGSVYESLLELHPNINVNAASFDLNLAAGSERKTTGSYYTPTSLINSLLDSALEPVVADRLKAAGKDRTAQEQAILSIRVVDPAAGSGHFLIAAAHRLARHLARVGSSDEEPAPAAQRAALRKVVRRCIHGVDLNEMAVELCKFALSLETLDPGKPLSFLDPNIQHGNSLIGATPALLEAGIPDEAFTPIEGDDRAYCAEFKRLNKQQRESKQMSMFAFDMQPWNRLGNLPAAMAQLAADDDTLAGERQREETYAKLVHSSDYEYSQLWADAWCAAFVWKKTKEFPYPITEEVFRAIERNPFDLAGWMKEEIERLREQYRFFHWHLAFPHIFHIPPEGHKAENEQTGWNGGFDMVLGNPPWERIKLQEKEWFATRRPDIANAPHAAQRRKLVEALPQVDPALYTAFLEDRRQAEGEGYFVRTSGRYPLCGRGDVNTYAIFAELGSIIQGQTGRVGIIVPSGIATDNTTRYFFQNLIETNSLVSLYSFENEEYIFPAVHHAMKFCLLTLSGNKQSHQEADFVFFARQVSYLQEENRHFSLSAADIALLNPDTRTCPIFRGKKDADLTKSIYRRIQRKDIENDSWQIYYIRLIHLGDHANAVYSEDQLSGDSFNTDKSITSTAGKYLRLYEAKLIYPFNHRYGTFDSVGQEEVFQGKARGMHPSELSDPNFVVKPRYWVMENFFRGIISKYPAQGGWLLAYRDITASTNERTCISTAIPETPSTVSLPCLGVNALNTKRALLLANLSSFCLDYVARQKVAGSHLTYGILKQLPILEPFIYSNPAAWSHITTLLNWLLPRVLELTYTAWDLQPFASECGYDGPPFRWDEARRFLLRCELDAAYFHLYGIARDDVDYIMDTFPIVKRKDEAAHGEYRTKRVILEIYDEMERAMESGQAYQSRLDPPPGDRRMAHPAKNTTEMNG